MAVSNDLNRKQYTIDSAPTTATTYAFDGRISALTDVYVQETTLTPALSGVTFDQSTDKFEKTAHGLVNGNVLQFNTTAITGFVAGTDYYVINKTDNTFELSLSITGDKVTVDGSSTVSVTTLVRSGATPLVVDLVAGADEDYEITPTTDEISGLITSFSISPTQGALDNGKFAVGSTITIYRQTDFKQDSDYRPNAILPANTLENNLDKLTMMAQQLKDDISRSIRFAESVTDPSNLSIAFDAAQRAGKILSFDSAGEFSISQEIGVWRSAWQNGRSYAARDLVFDDDETSDNRYSIYIAKASHTSDSVSAPLASGDGENWDKVLDASFFATKAGTAEGSATLAEEWASKVDGIVDSTDYSSKAYAIGGTGVTDTALKGAAKEWATKTSGTVDTSEYSAKEYAIGTIVTTGSSKAWASTAEDTEVTTGLYSSLHYNAKAQAAKTGAETAQTAAQTAQGLAETAQGLAETAQGLAEAAQAAAELVYDNFDDRYLGSKTSAPSVDNDGNALLVGALYFDSTAGALRVWDGSAWNSVEALPQPLATTDSPTFAGLDVTGTLTLGTALTADALARTPNWISAEQQLTGGNDVSVGFYSGSTTIAERRTINIPAMQLRINATVYTLSTATTLDADSSGSWASGETTYATAANRAGEDFYVYAVEPSSGTTPNFCLSANSTYPSGDVGGVTADSNNSRKIGGFHCLCASVGTITNHSLTGYLAGDILPRSVWDQHQHRPESSPEGMVFAGNRLWADIYLASVDTNLESKYGGTIVDGASNPDYHWYNFAERFAEINKRLPTQSEFMALAIGSNEETNISGSADPVTTGGHSDTAGRRMISNVGCEDCCGALWQWVNDTGGQNAGASWAVQDTAADTTSYDYANSIGRGQGYAVPTRGLVGGIWNAGAKCGSRGVAWNASPLDLGGSVGARGVSGSLY